MRAEPGRPAARRRAPATRTGGRQQLIERRIPDRPGTYVLILRLGRARRLAIGRLGTFLFQPGYYFYVGSAQGPGGIRGRVRHHLRAAARARWHIDYLRRAARPIGLWWDVGCSPLETGWAATLAEAAALREGPAGFGCSDRPGRTHLFWSAGLPETARRRLRATELIWDRGAADRPG